MTQSESDRDERQVINRLTDSFLRTKEYCEQRELIINSAKTQFIIFKVPRRKIEQELEIVLDGIAIKPALKKTCEAPRSDIRSPLHIWRAH